MGGSGSKTFLNKVADAEHYTRANRGRKEGQKKSLVSPRATHGCAVAAKLTSVQGLFWSQKGHAPQAPRTSFSSSARQVLMQVNLWRSRGGHEVLWKHSYRQKKKEMIKNTMRCAFSRCTRYMVFTNGRSIGPCYSTSHPGVCGCCETNFCTRFVFGRRKVMRLKHPVRHSRHSLDRCRRLLTPRVVGAEGEAGAVDSGQVW